MYKKFLGILEITVFINKTPCVEYIPLMNLKYLLDNNLWDTHKDDHLEFKRDLFDV